MANIPWPLVVLVIVILLITAVICLFLEFVRWVYKQITYKEESESAMDAMRQSSESDSAWLERTLKFYLNESKSKLYPKFEKVRTLWDELPEHFMGVFGGTILLMALDDDGVAWFELRRDSPERFFRVEGGQVAAYDASSFEMGAMISDILKYWDPENLKVG